MSATFQPDHFDDVFTIPLLQQAVGADGAVLDNTYFTAQEVDLDSYDHIVVCMSGGKDSIACLLHLLESGADRNRIELWHHDVDGNEGSTLMDWAFMRDYNSKLAAEFKLPLYFSWLDGGLEGEMLKQNGYSRAQHVDTPDGSMTLVRDIKRSKPNTRLRFPQCSGSLRTRWCSAMLKIDVGRRALNAQPRFKNSRTLFITGERRQESHNRAKYNQLEPHACDRRQGHLQRHVDSWRPVLDWSEEKVWDCLQRHRIIAPVPYRLGWTRSSCMTCIFNGARIWATMLRYFPERIEPIAKYEDQFGVTISRDRINVLEIANKAKPFEIEDMEALEQATRSEYMLPITFHDKAAWQLPAGAFGTAICGS